MLDCSWEKIEKKISQFGEAIEYLLNEDSVDSKT